MKRIDTSTRAIDLFGAGKDGFRDGDLANGVAPTAFNALWANAMQEEVMAVIEAAGLVGSDANLAQLLQAIRTMATGRMLGVQVFTNSGTYTPTPGALFAHFSGVSSGGGSGGIAATGAGQAACSGAGGAGNPFDFWVIGGLAAMAITLGAPGVGGSTAPGSGGDASPLLIGSIATIAGGRGGGAGPATGTFPSQGGSCVPTAASTIASAGGMVLAGIINGRGASAIQGAVLGLNALVGSTGGNSLYGAGGSPGGGAAGYGAGGGGRFQGQSQPVAVAGFAGTGGICRIEDYT
jgi:hypothetical protein